MEAADHVAAARAVYDASADAYVRFVGREISATTEQAVDIAQLDAFARLLADGPPGRVVDVGCGPGRVAGFLVDRGLEAFGVDPSTAMLDLARATHPTIEFVEGQLSRIPASDASLAGAVCWYSVIYTPPTALDEAFGELARVVRVGGPVLLAFQVGEGDGLHRPDAFGTGLPLTTYLHDPDHVTRRLASAGLHLHTCVVRAPAYAHESTPQAFLTARCGHP